MPQEAVQTKQSQLAKLKQTPKCFSNDPTKSCKTFCCECAKVVTLSGLRKHVKSHHQMTLTEYKDLYGNPKKQIIQLVYHKCCFCQYPVLLDTDELSKHLKKAHKVSYKEYMVRYMAKQQTSLHYSKVLNVRETVQKTVHLELESSLVIIRCDECPKTFKQNIQLKVHKRKHSAQ